MTLTIGIIGTGAMGAGIAQVAASNKCKVLLYDSNSAMLEKALAGINVSLSKLVDKEKITEAHKTAILGQIYTHKTIEELSTCDMVIEAIIEDLSVKQKVFSELEKVVSATCILASNTSSLSIASIAAACKKNERVIGIHFFNPAVLMPLVEIIPALTTSQEVFDKSLSIIA